MNFKIRLKNPIFWVQLLSALILPVLAYLGMTVQDLTTWDKVYSLLAQAVSNPYVLITCAVSVWSALTDPTTKGIGDSERALKYEELSK